MREFSMERFEVQQPISQLFKLCNKGPIFGVRLFQTIDKSPQIFQKKTDFYDKYHHFITLYIYTPDLFVPFQYATVDIHHVPLFAAQVCPGLFITPPYSSLFPLLPSDVPRLQKFLRGVVSFHFVPRREGRGWGSHLKL